MKNLLKHSKINFLIILLIIVFIPKFVFAESCPIVTVGLSQNNQKNKFSEVFALQMILSLYPQIYPDALVVGNFGPKTEAAIKRLQSDNGLNSNGVISEDTLELICSQYYQCPFQSMIGRGDELNPDQIIEVKMLQNLLKYLPKVKYTGAINGAIGAITEKAITTFQNAYSLYPTQILDYETNQKLCDIFSSLNTEKLSAPVATVATTKPKAASPLSIICVAEPSNAYVNQRVEFLSQVFGGKSPYKYY
jgi:peptidoglycan hydrolase-like protein with peptidoglycan-binding domain